MKNKHVGVNFDDRDIPAKNLPKEQIEETNVEKMVKTLQNRNIKYNREYYQKVQRKDKRAIDPDDIHDPRSLYDVEQENIDLKEQFIHQLMTLEQYLRVAQMWYAEQDDDYNPYNNEEQLNDQTNNESSFIAQAAGTVSDDGWVDYADKVNTIPDKVDEVEFDINAFNQSMVGNAILAESGSPFVQRQKSSFVVPKQVKSLN